MTGVGLSDYVRVLISSLLKCDTLNMDIDFAFSRPLDWIRQQQSFVYRWERRRFANSALMFVKKDSPIKRGILLGLLRREGTANPWVLFSEDNCRSCSLEILSCDRLDPRWSKTHPMGPSFLFIRTPDSRSMLRSLQTEFDAIHWHNHWDDIPEIGSPYELWIRELPFSIASELPPLTEAD